MSGSPDILGGIADWEGRNGEREEKNKGEEGRKSKRGKGAGGEGEKDVAARTRFLVRKIPIASSTSNSARCNARCATDSRVPRGPPFKRRYVTSRSSLHRRARSLDERGASAAPIGLHGDTHLVVDSNRASSCGVRRARREGDPDPEERTTRLCLVAVAMLRTMFGLGLRAVSGNQERGICCMSETARRRRPKGRNHRALRDFFMRNI